MSSAPLVSPRRFRPAMPGRGVWRAHPLLAYCLRRILAGVVLLVLVSMLVFVATAVLPGDAAEALLGRHSSPQTLAALREQLHLDEPLISRYLDWVGGLLHGDLGHTLGPSQAPITDLIDERLANTAILAVAAALVIVPLALVLGVIAGVNAGRPVDHGVSLVTLAAISIPDFVTATLLALVFAVWTGWLPATSLLAPGESPLAHPELLVLPVATLTIVGLAYTTRMVRAGVIEVMGSEYVHMARLNGIPERQVITQHVIRNSLAPSVQVIALTMQWLLGGVFVVETLFAYPGIGLGLVQAVTVRDIPYVQAVAIIIAAIYIAINLIADLVTVMLIPRLRTAQ